jgi:hypothetical protein
MSSLFITSTFVLSVNTFSLPSTDIIAFAYIIYDPAFDGVQLILTVADDPGATSALISSPILFSGSRAFAKNSTFYLSAVV